MPNHRHVLFLFLDGVGIGAPDPRTNPFAAVALPTWQKLLAGWDGQANWVATDANLGVAGRPQSATGQATLLTGRNVAHLVGEHWGPKPNAAVRAQLEHDTLFHRLTTAGKTARLANAFPPSYFAAVQKGKRLPGAIAYAVRAAGLPWSDQVDLAARRAFSADFTGEGWQQHLGVTDSPLWSPWEAGQALTQAAQQGDLLFFEYWLSDHMGHRGDLPAATVLLQTLDAVLAGILANWDFNNGLLLITSDHGDLEDLSHSHHTQNPVPTILAGAGAARADLLAMVRSLQDITPLLLHYLLAGDA